MDEERKVSAFEHENALMHYGNVNKRSMIMLISVCVTCVLLTLINVIGNIIGEQRWRETIERICTPTTEVAADEGVHKQPDP